MERAEISLTEGIIVSNNHTYNTSLNEYLGLTETEAPDKPIRTEIKTITKEDIELKIDIVSGDFTNYVTIKSYEKNTNTPLSTIFKFNLSRNRPGACCGVKELGNFNLYNYPNSIGYNLLTDDLRKEAVKGLFDIIIKNSRAGNRKFFIYFTIVLIGTSGVSLLGNQIVNNIIQGDERYALQESFINKNSGNENHLYIIKN